jgi:hypothetical protein
MSVSRSHSDLNLATLAVDDGDGDGARACVVDEKPAGDARATGARASSHARIVRPKPLEPRAPVLAEGSVAALALQELAKMQQQLLGQVASLTIEELELVQMKISQQREALLDAVQRESARALRAAEAASSARSMLSYGATLTSTPGGGSGGGDASLEGGGGLTPGGGGATRPSPPSPKGSVSAGSVRSSRSAFSAVRCGGGHGDDDAASTRSELSIGSLRNRSGELQQLRRSGFNTNAAPMALSYRQEAQLEKLVAKQKRSLGHRSLGQRYYAGGGAGGGFGGGFGLGGKGGGRHSARAGGASGSGGARLGRSHLRSAAGSGGRSRLGRRRRLLRDEASDDELQHCISDGAGEWDLRAGHEGRHNPHGKGILSVSEGGCAGSGMGGTNASSGGVGGAVAKAGGRRGTTPRKGATPGSGYVPPLRLAADPAWGVVVKPRRPRRDDAPDSAGASGSVCQTVWTGIVARGGGGGDDILSVTSEDTAFSSFSHLSSSFDHPHAFSPRAGRGKSLGSQRSPMRASHGGSVGTGAGGSASGSVSGGTGAGAGTGAGGVESLHTMSLSGALGGGGGASPSGDGGSPRSRSSAFSATRQASAQ